ncbi:MAG TPA: histidinol-phosphatase [Porphyromonadaceae bacterium]|nr:histidinol-phosphatase [Porphyromonadaceae bacterium]
MHHADLHIHTCLSPCGSLEMSPRNIIRVAKAKGLQMIAITDHNTTGNVHVCVELGSREGIYVIPGCEVNTREEVHCLCYFPHLQAMEVFQGYLEERMTGVKNDPARFGYQVVVDEDDAILYEEERSLFVGIDDEVEGVAEQVHRLGGIFVPAHVDRPKNSLLSQLGFIPHGLVYDALEVSRATTVMEFVEKHPELRGNRFLQNSDAHYLKDIATVHNAFYMDRLDWGCFKAAFREKKNPGSQINCSHG